MNKHVYLLALIFAVACLIRLYPTIISGLPFSTDGWSSIRNSELLIQYTPIPLDNPVFDGYNSYWPAISLFGAVASEVTGLSPVMVMAYGVPLAGTLAVPLFFVLVRRITQNVQAALFSSALLATIYPYVQFTAGVTKETFAYPLLVGLLLVFLMKPSMGKYMLFALASVALVFTHHLAAIVAFAVLASLALGLFFGKKGNDCFSVKSSIFLLLFFGAALLGYFGFYAYAGLTFALTFSDFLTMAAYQVLVLSLVLFFILKPSDSNPRLFQFKTRLILSFVTLTSALLLMVFVTERSFLAGSPILPIHYLLYLSPYFVLFPLLFFSFSNLREFQTRLLIPLFWIAPIAAFEGYAIFGGAPMGLTLVVRLINFLILPLCILFGLAFGKIQAYFKDSPKQKIVAVGIIVILVAVSCVNCYNVYASVCLQEPFMGYFWFYRQPENAACSWVAAHDVNQSVAGDVKVSYLLNGYYNVPVDVSSGLKFLGESGSAPELLLVYPEMPTNGYVIYGGYALTLPDGYESKLSGLNHVYSNNLVNLYAN